MKVRKFKINITYYERLQLNEKNVGLLVDLPPRTIGSILT